MEIEEIKEIIKNELRKEIIKLDDEITEETINNASPDELKRYLELTEKIKQQMEE